MSNASRPAEGCDAAAMQLRGQVQGCYRLGSPLYGRLLELAAADCEAAGPSWSILQGHEHEATGSALALRFMGAVHRLVLEGHTPTLARFYPSAGGRGGSGDEAWPAFSDTLTQHRDRVRDLLRLPVQTNEVGRSASLLGGFLTVARATGLPLRLLELGSSAGLNLRWDQYRYDSAGGAWGDMKSLVRFHNVFLDRQPPLDVEVSIATRSGCDAVPIDPCSAEGRLTLRTYVWPDQHERYTRLNGALAIAARVGAVVERADAREWLVQQLTRPAEGSATVVFHSIVMQYLGRQGAAQIRETLHVAGTRATNSAPLAWLRLEPAKDAVGEWEYRVFLTMWPEGEERILATSSPHGPPVRWLA